jgi:hypothetical protein
MISTVHKIGAKAERKVSEKLIGEFKHVAGKERLLFRLAEASIRCPDGAVKEVVFPVVGERTLQELVAEYKSSGYRRTVQRKLKASYTNHYRRGLIRLLSVLEFRSNNTAHRPVLDALELIARYAHASKLSYYPTGETVPAPAGIDEDWREPKGNGDRPTTGPQHYEASRSTSETAYPTNHQPTSPDPTHRSSDTLGSPGCSGSSCSRGSSRSTRRVSTMPTRATGVCIPASCRR